MRQCRKDPTIRQAGGERGTRLLANHDDFEESTDPELTEHAFVMLQSGDLTRRGDLQRRGRPLPGVGTVPRVRAPYR